MKTTISVTRSDITMGLRHSCGWCPVALAIKRMLYAKTDIAVDAAILFLDESGRWAIIAKTPRKAISLIEAFDRGVPVTPTSFVLDIPERLLKRGPSATVPSGHAAA